MVQEIIDLYTEVVSGTTDTVSEQTDRASGGVVRAFKGKLVEEIAKLIVKQAWLNIGGELGRLGINPIDQRKKHSVQIQGKHKDILPDFVAEDIDKNREHYYYGISVDTHVYIDNTFVVGIECKTFTENAMFKRILVDFQLLRLLFPNLVCCLLQLETQLGGENTLPLSESRVANQSTYTLMSYFPTVPLSIMTLLEGKREVERPIHKPEFFKEMKPEFVGQVIDQFSDLLTPFK